MKRIDKSDPERWRDQFERTGENPVARQLIARAHLADANVLLQPLRLPDVRNAPADGGCGDLELSHTAPIGAVSQGPEYLRSLARKAHTDGFTR